MDGWMDIHRADSKTSNGHISLNNCPILKIQKLANSTEPGLSFFEMPRCRGRHDGHVVEVDCRLPRQRAILMSLKSHRTIDPRKLFACGSIKDRQSEMKMK